jgi:hypothetical protein
LILAVAPQKKLVKKGVKKSRAMINPKKWTSGRDRRNENIEPLCDVVEDLEDVEEGQI